MNRVLRSAFVIEQISVGLIQYMIYETYSNEKICNNLRNISYYVHQNCMNLLEFILSKLKAIDPKNVNIKKKLYIELG